MICPEPEEPRDAGSGHARPDRGALQSVFRHISRQGGCMPMAELPGSAAPESNAASPDALLAPKLLSRVRVLLIVAEPPGCRAEIDGQGQTRCN